MYGCCYRTVPRKKVPKTPYGGPKPRKLSAEYVFELVKKIALSRRADYMDGQIAMSKCWVTAEEIAAELNVEIHKVTQALQKLNLMRLVEQKTRNFAHDTKRNRMFKGPSSGWAANQYEIIVPLPVYNGPVTHSEPKPLVVVPKGSILVWDEKVPEKKPRYSKRLGRRIYK